MDYTTFVGLVASIGTASSLVPQLVKIIKEKKAGAVSLVMLAVLFAGVSAWIYYGVLKSDWIIIASNCFSLVVNLAVAFLSIKYKKLSGAST